MQTEQVGRLAKKYLNVDLPLRVCESRAGYFIGTMHPTDGPFSRESAEYYPDRASAEQALAEGAWTQLDGYDI